MTTKELYELLEGDYDSAMRTLGSDGIMARIIVKLPEDRSFPNLIKAKQENDPKGLFESAHAMKGVCANLGLMKLSALASEVTEEFRPGSQRKMDDGQVNAKIREIATLYNKTVETINRFAGEQ